MVHAFALYDVLSSQMVKDIFSSTQGNPYFKIMMIKLTMSTVQYSILKIKCLYKAKIDDEDIFYCLWTSYATNAIIINEPIC